MLQIVHVPEESDLMLRTDVIVVAFIERVKANVLTRQGKLERRRRGGPYS